jgi:hypothetical protein
VPETLAPVMYPRHRLKPPRWPWSSPVAPPRWLVPPIRRNWIKMSSDTDGKSFPFAEDRRISFDSVQLRSPSSSSSMLLASGWAGESHGLLIVFFHGP